MTTQWSKQAPVIRVLMYPYTAVIITNIPISVSLVKEDSHSLKQYKLININCLLFICFISLTKTTMEEISNLIAEGQKKLFWYRNSKFAGEFKTRAMAETTSLSSTRRLKPKLINIELKFKQVAQWAAIAHLRASMMFGDTIIYDDLRQITLNLKQWPGINSKT